LPFGKVSRWLADHLVQNVPEEVSVCEYDCQESHCNIAKWAICEKRRQQPAGRCFERE
jgi:hypothetical protein